MDTSRPTLVIAALVSAFLVGALWAGSAHATHQNLYQTIVTPPTFPTGQLSYNSCGWHVGDCRNNQDGYALDWGYGNTMGSYDYDVRFRGWLYRSNTSYSGGYLMLNIFQWTSGTDVCDEAVADVIEIAPWKVRYGMHYIHTYISQAGGYPLYVSGSGIGTWNSPTVAHMVYDPGGCPWTAYHVHAQAVPVALSYYYENRTISIYPCCNYGGQLRQNNLEGYQTHKMQFWQGH